MIQRINEIIAGQSNGTIDAENIYVIDYKNINGGEVEILENQPEHDCVHLTNEKKVNVHYVAFKENALKVKTPEGQVKQCECVLFPTSLNADDWVLFIETKYTSNLKTALDEKVDYPNTMIAQIISTVSYFRDNGILPPDKKVFAIVSFPKLIEAFSEAFFTRSNLTREEISIRHKILLSPTNEGIIKSQTRIKI
ncbi:hypothetical protein [Flavobacterium sp.]|jgi:hypothetical protein|uniref:hypothetical protein n=1 Tax=Flavobacterium sp. TaxID=239 RepID=UPI0022BF7164|nr:hypothetical protein [Flavobacterium sp.]MCZ8145007.1 hypothetical protein [Flavobacterium sp.]MCZ8368289.1 hypothetical protein [Flavobacterium sp.]